MIKSKWTLGQQILIAFAFALALLVTLSFISYQSVSGLLKTSRSVQQTRELITNLDDTLSSLKDAETGQRGFLLTGNEQYLTPYEIANPRIDQGIQRLRQLLSDNPKQLRRLAEMEKTTSTRLVYLKRGIEQRRQQGEAFVVPVEILDIGRQMMDQLRQLVAEMKEEELNILGTRENEVNLAAERTLFVLPLGSVLAVVVTLLAYLTIRRELERRKMAEDKMNALNRELERSNRELQDFAFVASHDLQEPLRKIQAFGDLLMVQYGQQLGAEGKDFVSRMQNASRRMHTLINDLLTFSRVTTKGQPFTQVNLDQITRDVLNDLETRMAQTGGKVEVAPLPTLEADPTQMRQLLQNLIGNALKFHRPEVQPEIKVTSQMVNATETSLPQISEQELCQITVEDNGIGFDEKYLDRIFTPFQRLHARSAYEGTGMGLAVCRKIVERHGGHITARSAPGQGTAFVITLPLKHAQEQNSLQPISVVNGNRQNL